MARRFSFIFAFCVFTFAAHAGFEIRGIKGLYWDGLEKYRLALPWLAEHDQNFLMLCYTSFPASAKDWRADYTPAEIDGIKQLAADAEKLHVTLCASFNPGIWSKPPLVYADEHDYQLALRKVQKLHEAGILWFGLCLDDISRKLDAADVAKYKTLEAAQVDFVNRLWSDTKKLDPRCRLIFCPSAYTTEDAEKHLDYIRTIGDGIDPEVMIFWTGPRVCSPSITGKDARHIATLIKRKPFVWDNYPVNDMFPWRPLLAPMKNRSADLPAECAGYLANPMKQWHASKIPLGTVARYTSNPQSYDPQRAMREVIDEYPADQRPAIEALLKIYGTTFLGEANYPARLNRLDECKKVQQLLSQNHELDPLWQDIKPTLDGDIAKLQLSPPATR
jgi:hyaluronoglucosaminidase